MISIRSCNTENWSNDEEILLCIIGITLHFIKKKKKKKNILIIFHNIAVFICVFFFYFSLIK